MGPKLGQRVDLMRWLLVMQRSTLLELVRCDDEVNRPDRLLRICVRAQVVTTRSSRRQR